MSARRRCIAPDKGVPRCQLGRPHAETHREQSSRSAVSVERSSQLPEPEHKAISFGTIVRNVAKATAVAALVLAAVWLAFTVCRHLGVVCSLTVQREDGYIIFSRFPVFIADVKCKSGHGCEIWGQSGGQLLQRSSVVWRVLELWYVEVLRLQLRFWHEVMAEDTLISHPSYQLDAVPSVAAGPHSESCSVQNVREWCIRSFLTVYGMRRSQAPTVAGSTSYSFGWGLVPFGGYGYGGYGGQVGGYGGGGGGGIGSLLLYGFIAAVAFSALSGFFKNNEGDVYGALPLQSLASYPHCLGPDPALASPTIQDLSAQRIIQRQITEC